MAYKSEFSGLEQDNLLKKMSSLETINYIIYKPEDIVLSIDDLLPINNKITVYQRTIGFWNETDINNITYNSSLITVIPNVGISGNILMQQSTYVYISGNEAPIELRRSKLLGGNWASWFKVLTNNDLSYDSFWQDIDFLEDIVSYPPNFINKPQYRIINNAVVFRGSVYFGIEGIPENNPEKQEFYGKIMTLPEFLIPQVSTLKSVITCNKFNNCTSSINKETGVVNIAVSFINKDIYGIPDTINLNQIQYYIDDNPYFTEKYIKYLEENNKKIELTKFINSSDYINSKFKKNNDKRDNK